MKEVLSNMDRKELIEMLIYIHTVIDYTEWDSGTAQSIASIYEAKGIPVHEPL